MDEYVASNKLNRIEKRGIEALAVTPIILTIAQRIGMDEARSILREVNQNEAFERGKRTKKSKGQNGIEELVREVDGWGEGGGWEMDVLQQTPATYFFNVTRCPYYEKYSELGLVEFGVEFSCCRDEPYARGLNPNLKLVRTMTIMEGAEYCDFRYYLSS